jgi:hypothetical protein
MSADINWRHDPGYHAGFFDAQHGEPLFPDAHPAYKAGWEAYWTCEEILSRAGFTKDEGNRWSKTTIVGGGNG